MAALLANPATARAQCQFDVTIIQAPECPPFGPQWTYGSGLNEDGDIAGYHCVCLCNSDQAFGWTSSAGLVDLELPDSGASDLNDVAWIVGSHGTPSGDFGFVYDGKQFISLGTLPGGNMSRANAVNNAGQVVGFWGNNVTGPLPLAFLWQGGKMIDITPDFGTPNSRVNDLNENGQATGWMGSDFVNDGSAFIWQDGQVTELPSVPGVFRSQGSAINNEADVGGKLKLGSPQAYVEHAFLWTGSQVNDLGTLPGFQHSSAGGINDESVVVGASWYHGGNPSSAFVWKQGVMTDLNEVIEPRLELLLVAAWGINSAGQIGAFALTADDDAAAVLLTPRPQPLGDLDGDCAVGINDFLTLLSAWGPCPSSAACPADLDGDGNVGVVDFLTVLGNWG